MRIAVVGSGVTGLGAAWLLSKTHDVTLFEAQDRIGGHSNTVVVEEAQRATPIDTGFIVYNIASYPNLIALFAHLDVPTAPTEMSFSVSMENGAYEYSGNGLRGLFGQYRNILSVEHWRMVRDLMRFFKQASSDDATRIDPEVSLGKWLVANGYSDAFVQRHILPMGAAIWSTPANEMLAFPMAAFARFFSNHGLLQVANRPQWRTVVGGSKVYVSRILDDFSGKVIKGDGVARVMRSPSAAEITTVSGHTEAFDACVLACHADEALALLGDPTKAEQNLLSKFRYAKNRAVLHRDRSQMPVRHRLWTSWNYLSTSVEVNQRLAVTYWMNKLQPLETSHDYFVTLNPIVPVDPDKTIKQVDYTHPIYDAGAMDAQRDLWTLQGKQRTWFAGSYFGYGFHEDGLQAGLAVAEDLGGRSRPWNVPNARGRVLADGAHANARNNASARAAGEVRPAAQARSYAVVK